jgi:hypothetical protein
MAARARSLAVIRGPIWAFWNEKADVALRAITPTEIEKGGAYDVSAEIRSAQGGPVASGAYDARTGIHAEIAALATCSPQKSAVVSVSPPPCRRCAALLARYVEADGWSIEAPQRTFAPTYAGAYHLPPFLVDDVVVGWLVRSHVITPVEAEAHRNTIVSDFLGGAWCT